MKTLFGLSVDALGVVGVGRDGADGRPAPWGVIRVVDTWKRDGAAVSVFRGGRLNRGIDHVSANSLPWGAHTMELWIILAATNVRFIYWHFVVKLFKARGRDCSICFATVF